LSFNFSPPPTEHLRCPAPLCRVPQPVPCQPVRRLRFLVQAGVPSISLLGERARCAREFRQRTAVLIFLWVTNPASLGKRRYAHTAADLHVRSGFSNRAGLKNRWTPRAM